ncbi:Phenylalanine ammonia-lyase 3,Phenylalanine ammonia-lyase class 1,Phenylalanine ammonia-lyase 2,Phenylalanine ammonia-lyase G2B,Phenylalanine ammonia-lyase,Phenylalanine ammonia-lyase G4,Phenylalanine/tyrosine ammonia-lyase,Phenylalanine ammonia-lyase class 2,Phenylalanine ammonia-lyase 4,Phenylalanine ammonia-lyase 1,Phenylalanine aminomutase (L-beta-phenylalanine forming),Phenylalanine ammonia-lyase class 3,Phenylalanine ammonia-lyase G1 [Mytilus coruscus]|uniref:Major facilitator superfamily (MFS) profile domain-containing protein n=1 Tax=Mytilus coruscus TaxID=42192 RepID=A0A6J8A412_MYTCO|nr:Phenylalanine ammonia-lyase 3,Phenylalanine ammonia-lyase class 1,Phenylalanine ammonia-lyase 2,Phenylalanine ammonia-lyase G2B,Phenylalanine ammonia-lyase,Phenylalanine ammonia-lyase G4,Phenylalanine/tyrosine ammonia-lyase,Phenylalanine ammonia-lyase class 2,Phenylalanine ammonia-lyase 4,Phenylalanine ammonia-lyase 1,Phenylalanine aminomutase (L-beta-phenylalanine forming),Phenylalanine ammonia-lyase class 3,Phenylalanine ammonia-lyase G1 [Mytilus coruscus]
MLSILEDSKLVITTLDMHLPDKCGVLKEDHYSIRSSPQWLGSVVETLNEACRRITIELNSANDNPLIDHRIDTVLHNANFQGETMSITMDQTRQALGICGKLQFALFEEVVNDKLNCGLPPNLSGCDINVDFGFKGCDIAMASYMSELDHFVNLMSNHVLSAECHNQAINSMALVSARFTSEAVEILQMMTANLLLLTAQAIDLRHLRNLILKEIDLQEYPDIASTLNETEWYDLLFLSKQKADKETDFLSEKENIEAKEFLSNRMSTLYSCACNGNIDAAKQMGKGRVMSKPCKKKDEDNDSNHDVQAPDGGWGWIVVVGPISSVLSTRFSCRSMTIVGGVFTSIGWLTTGFMPKIEYMFITYGLVAGIGKSLANSPTVIILGRWFDKRRSLVNGLSTAGSGVGTFIFAPLLELLFRKYGFQGSMLVMSGVMLNMCVCGSLFRSVPKSAKHKVSSLNGISNKVFTIDESTDFAMAVEERMQNKTVNGISNTIITEILINDSNDKKCQQSIFYRNNKKKSVKDYLDYTLLTNNRFLCFCISFMLATLGHSPAFIMLPALAMQFNISSKDATFILSISGIADIIGRIMLGVLCDIKFFKKNRQNLYVFAIFTSGVASICCVFASEYWHFVLYSCILGLFAGGSYNVLPPVILVDLLGVENLASSCGIALLFQGLGFLVGPPMAVFLTDKFGDYQSGFYFAGVSMVISSIVVSLSIICERLNRSKYEIDKADRKVNDLDLADQIMNETNRSSEITMNKLYARRT